MVASTEIALMFSGGLDSTATAARLATQHTRVHLLHYANGYGHFGLGRAEKRTQALQAAIGDRFSLHLLPTKDLFDDIVVQRIAQEARDAGGAFVWCMGCKLAMHLRSAEFCLEHGIPALADGSNQETSEMVEQMRVSLTLIAGFYSRWGIRFETPVYEQGRQASRDYLKGKGVPTGLTLMDRQIGVQPTCLWGELYYLPYVLFNKRVRHDERQVAGFIAGKQAQMDALLRGRLQARGFDADQLAEHMRNATT
ncbi:MAG: hypothetical protein FJ100_14085 [Deltaproteobacteria bacterium]|nr:hypothetical protein [Deltaproteobacteria bacterium]